MGCKGHMDTEGKGLGSWEGSRDRGSWVFKAEWKCGPERPPICPWRQVILAWGKEIASQIHNLRAALAVLAYATWPGCPSEDTHKKKCGLGWEDPVGPTVQLSHPYDQGGVRQNQEHQNTVLWGAARIKLHFFIYYSFLSFKCDCQLLVINFCHGVHHWK